MKKKLFTSCLLVTIIFSSCKKYLDKPTSTSVGYPTTVANCQALLDNIEVMNEARTPGFVNGSSDDCFLSQDQFNSVNAVSQDIYLWNEPDLSTHNDWLIGYAPIYTANVCLQHIDNIEKSDNVSGWNNVKGSAFFFRAYYFLQLAWEYSKAYDNNTADQDLGIALKSDIDLYALTTRSTVRQTYDQIINDAKQALLYLPDTASHPLRPSKAAAYGLLARSYLSMGKYDEALIYADKCLTLKSRLIDYNGDIDLISDFSTPVSPFKLFNKETIFYSSAAQLLTVPGISTSYVDSTLYTSYDPDDLRKSAFFTKTGNYNAFKGVYTQDVYKYFSGIATDEIFLIRAECRVRRNDLIGALADLNSLLSRRWRASNFDSVSATTSQEALQIILQERRKELLMRGIRWADIKRLNKDGNTITLKRFINNETKSLPPNDNRYALSIPLIVIQQSGMPQNPR
jgi:tetratricopeptide (TPR) repeat protein